MRTLTGLKNLKRVPAVLAGLLFSACSPLAMVNALVPDDNHRSETAIAYGPEDRHRLDLFRPPEGQEAKGVLVFFYGGSWKTGDRGGYRFIGEAFASRGFIVVVPDYRLYPEVQFPGFVEDSAQAVAWARRNLIDPADPAKDLPLVLMGHSAGAHIAALLALDASYLDSQDLPADSVSAWIGLAGPYSFDPLAYRSVRAVFESLSEDEVDQARPITFARKGAPPALLLHGASDGTVYPRNSRELAEALTNLDVPVRLEELPDTGHIGILISLARPLGDPALVIDPSVAFMEGLRDKAPRE